MIYFAVPDESKEEKNLYPVNPEGTVPEIILQGPLYSYIYGITVKLYYSQSTSDTQACNERRGLGLH